MFILDLSPTFFSEKTAVELTALGYSKEQLEFIRGELAKQNLSLNGEPVAKARTVELSAEEKTEESLTAAIKDVLADSPKPMSRAAVKEALGSDASLEAVAGILKQLDIAGTAESSVGPDGQKVYRLRTQASSVATEPVKPAGTDAGAKEEPQSIKLPVLNRESEKHGAED